VAQSRITNGSERRKHDIKVLQDAQQWITCSDVMNKGRRQQHRINSGLG
jgi:hypothetical protein